MGGLFTKPRWSDGIRHQSFERYTTQYDINKLEKRRVAADYQGYFACQGLGKSDGYRMWQCTHRAVTFREAHAWIKHQSETAEAPMGSPRRNWESPYMYTVVQVDNLDELEYMLGEKPVMVHADT
jgi:hypothetical protein